MRNARECVEIKRAALSFKTWMMPGLHKRCEGGQGGEFAVQRKAKQPVTSSGGSKKSDRKKAKPL